MVRVRVRVRAVLCQKIGQRNLHGCTCINAWKIRGSCLTLASAALELQDPVEMLPWISRLLHFPRKVSKSLGLYTFYHTNTVVLLGLNHLVFR